MIAATASRGSHGVVSLATRPALVYSPMKYGLLSGAMTEARVAGAPVDDWRCRHPDLATRLAANLALTALDRTGAGRGPLRPG